jgi:hypothetical protein
VSIAARRVIMPRKYYKTQQYSRVVQSANSILPAWSSMSSNLFISICSIGVLVLEYQGSSFTEV